MPHQRCSDDEIVDRGQELYGRAIRPHVEPRHNGKFLALDIETGEYEIDADSVVAVRRAKAKHADAVLYIHRIGHPTAYRLGGRFPVNR